MSSFALLITDYKSDPLSTPFINWTQLGNHTIIIHAHAWEIPILPL